MPPRQVKPKPEVSETTPAPVSAPAPVDTAPTSSVQEKPKVKKTPKPKPTEDAPAPAPVPTPEPVSAPAPTPEPTVEATDAVVVDADVAELVSQSAEFLLKLNQLGSLFGSLKAEFRLLEKKWSRELKVAQKSQSKRKRKSGNLPPSGFVKPTKISDEFATFLDKPSGSEMARTDVTREINKYIRAHDLQDKQNGRKINFDAQLQSLLKLESSDELTYFNLQRFMSPHFTKTAKA